jgi:hypothetical protein
MRKDDTEQDYSQPVAYDAHGQPLYAHPPAPMPEVPQKDTLQAVPSIPGQPGSLHVTRAFEPTKPVISEVVRLKHERSKKLFPDLNLSEGEYVISAVRRHWMGLVPALGSGFVVICLVFIAIFNPDILSQIFGVDQGALILSLMLIAVLSAALMYVAYYVYTSNKFFLTNESVIQEIQSGIFERKEQTISLANVEDASYRQEGIFEQIFDYGSIRLSTQGDETTYRLTFVVKPKDHIAQLNNAVEAFKNGRPIE